MNKEKKVQSGTFSNRVRTFSRCMSLVPFVVAGLALLAPLARPALCGKDEHKEGEKLDSIARKVRRNQEGNVKSVLFYEDLKDDQAEAVDFTLFSRLVSLSVCNGEITDKSFEQFAKIPKLSYVNLMKTRISDKGMSKFLKQQRYLYSITCFKVPITDMALQGLSDHEGLRVIEFRDMRIGDHGAKEIAKVKHLFALEMSECDVSDAGLADISRMPILTFLCLDGTKVSDKGILQLGEMKGLRILELRGTKITDEGADALRKLLPRLTIVR